MGHPRLTTLKRILVMETLAILWSAAITTIIILIYSEHDQARKLFAFWLVVSQLFVLLHIRKAPR
jgi:hypothetical protein